MNLVDDSNSLQRARKKVRVGSIRVVSSLLASVTLVGALTLGISWKFVHGVAQAVTPIASSAELQTLSTPIINARRNPETLSHDVRFRSLSKQLTLLGKRLPAESCLIIDIEGTRLVSVNPDIPLLPASNMKVVVAMVALDVLTPDFVFSTSLVGKTNGNAIDGDAYLIGGGDPVLVTGNYPVTEPYPTFNFTRLEDLFDALVKKGITRIGGSIIGDESRYDAERFSPSLGLGIKGTEIGPLGALMVNDGVVSGNPIKPVNPALGAATEFTNTLQKIGFAVSGEGSREAGLEAMKAKLVEWGIPLDVLQFFDGSGLDRGNRLTCNSLMTLLARDGGFGPVGLGLATANQTGTLREVLADTLGAGKLRGKTGTLTGAKALSGFVPFSADQASTFSLIINSPNAANQTTYRPIWNALSDALGGFSGSPTASEIAPN